MISKMSNLENYRQNEVKMFAVANLLLILVTTSLFNSYDLNNRNIDLVYGFIQILKACSIPAIIYIYVLIVVSCIPTQLKLKLSLFFFNPPGFSVFSNIKRYDVDIRFTKNQAKSRYQTIYEKINHIKNVEELGRFENSCWYKIYQQYRNIPKIYCAQRDFLVCRDITLIALIMFFGILVFSQIFQIRDITVSLIFTFIEYVIGCFATTFNAKRFVYGVIAEDISSSTTEKPYKLEP